jgi:hypothetical protein
MDKKLKVQVDSLKVDSFEVDAARKGEGTVHAHATPAGGACCTLDGTGCHTVVVTNPCNNC